MWRWAKNFNNLFFVSQSKFLLLIWNQILLQCFITKNNMLFLKVKGFIWFLIRYELCFRCEFNSQCVFYCLWHLQEITNRIDWTNGMKNSQSFQPNWLFPDQSRDQGFANQWSLVRLQASLGVWEQLKMYDTWSVKKYFFKNPWVFCHFVDPFPNSLTFPVFRVVGHPLHKSYFYLLSCLLFMIGSMNIFILQILHTKATFKLYPLQQLAFLHRMLKD